MAHKKGVGSSKNGRESASKRLGVKIFGLRYSVAKLARQATSSFVREVQNSTRATTSVWVVTTLSTPW